MESEDTYDGFGINPRYEEFFTTAIGDGNFNPGGDIGGFSIILSTEILHNYRSIYSTLDFLGDVGGLFDMLRLVAGVII